VLLCDESPDDDTLLSKYTYGPLIYTVHVFYAVHLSVVMKTAKMHGVYNIKFGPTNFCAVTCEKHVDRKMKHECRNVEGWDILTPTHTHTHTHTHTPTHNLLQEPNFEMYRFQ
jgi:hypothetical protein